MLKIAGLDDSDNKITVTASIKSQDDAVRLQRIFNSLVADQFCFELGLGFAFDMERGEGGYYPAVDYPEEQFFQLTYDHEKGKVYLTVPNP